jgi:hypothetical protein
MKRASTEHSLLLVLHGRMDVSGEAIAVMRQTLDYDPMFGGVVARTRCSTGCCVRRPSRGLTPGAWVPRRILADTPELEICPEVFESALLLSPTAVAEFGPLDEGFSTLPGAIVHYLSRARRCGYRTVLANRAVVIARCESCGHTGRRASAAIVSDESLLREITPDFDRRWKNLEARGMSGSSISARTCTAPPAALQYARCSSTFAMSATCTTAPVKPCWDARMPFTGFRRHWM